MTEAHTWTSMADGEPDWEDHDGPYRSLVAELIRLQSLDPGWAMALLCCYATDEDGKPLSNAAIAERMKDAGVSMSQDWYAEKVRLLRISMAEEMPGLAGVVSGGGV